MSGLNETYTQGTWQVHMTHAQKGVAMWELSEWNFTIDSRVSMILYVTL